MRILIADDNADIAETLALLLRCRGHDVWVSYTARDSVKAADRLQPHAILHDLAMPGMSGYDAMGLIRKQAGGKALFAVAITSHDTLQHRERAKQAGFDHFFSKPVDPDVIFALLESAPGTVIRARGAAPQRAAQPPRLPTS